VYGDRHSLEPTGRKRVKYAYRCPNHGCEVAVEADDDSGLDRRVARHDARSRGRRFDRARFDDRLELF
jgi:hypothetical protein